MQCVCAHVWMLANLFHMCDSFAQAALLHVRLQATLLHMCRGSAKYSDESAVCDHVWLQATLLHMRNGFTQTMMKSRYVTMSGCRPLCFICAKASDKQCWQRCM
jgi:hypothetical protein